MNISESKKMRTTDNMKTISTISSRIQRPCIRTRGRLTLKLIFIAALAIPTLAAEAQQRTSFQTGTPTSRSGFAVTNGSPVTLSAVLSTGKTSVQNAPVSIYQNMDGRETRIASNVRTDRNGRFSLNHVFSLPTGSIPPGGKNISWAAEFAPIGGNFRGSSTRNYIAEWGFRVTR